MELAFVISGLLVGFVIGLSGVGGGSLMTPLLVMGFGIPPATAVGTDLLYAGLTKASCTIFRGKLGSINWKVAVILALGSVPAAIFTSIYFLSPTTLSNETAQLITRMLGVMLCVTALSLIFRKQLQSVSKRVFRVGAKTQKTRIMIATLTLGAVLGILVTLTSVGAGAIGFTALLVLYPQLPTNHLVGTDIMHAVPLTLIAGLSHAVAGSVDYQLLFALLIGSIPGVILGSLVAHKIPETLLQWVLGTVLLLVGLKLLI